jgi:alpha-L-fucosidase
MHVHFWPGEYVAVSGLKTKVKSAKLVKTGAALKFMQDDFRVRILDLPVKAPGFPVTTIALECESEPTQNTDYVRENKPRMDV